MITATVYFGVPPGKVYEALMDEKIHSVITGSKATIDNRIGGKFSVWDGYAIGKTIDLELDKKIVQTWRASDWSKGVTSTVTIEFFSEKNGTKLEFLQENIPKECEKDIKEGWREYYWEPMKKYFENK